MRITSAFTCVSGKAQGDVGDVGDSPAKSMRKLQKELEEMIKKGDDVTPAEMKKMRHKCVRVDLDLDMVPY